MPLRQEKMCHFWLVFVSLFELLKQYFTFLSVLSIILNTKLVIFPLFSMFWLSTDLHFDKKTFTKTFLLGMSSCLHHVLFERWTPTMEFTKYAHRITTKVVVYIYNNSSRPMHFWQCYISLFELFKEHFYILYLSIILNSYCLSTLSEIITHSLTVSETWDFKCEFKLRLKLFYRNKRIIFGGFV